MVIGRPFYMLYGGDFWNSYAHFREDTNPMSHFLASVTELFEYALRNCEDSDMVGITISN